MPSWYGGSFDKALRLLREYEPVGVPVQVVTVNDLDAYAYTHVYTNKKGDITRFRIEVSRELPHPSALDCLIHEWGHVLDYWENGIPKKVHRDSWGSSFARAYRAVNCLGKYKNE